MPKRIAVIHLSAHQKGNTFEAIGNCIADEEAKKAGEEEIEIYSLIPEIRKPEVNLVFTEKEKERLIQIGGQEGELKRVPIGWKTNNK